MFNQKANRELISSGSYYYPKNISNSSADISEKLRNIKKILYFISE